MSGISGGMNTSTAGARNAIGTSTTTTSRPAPSSGSPGELQGFCPFEIILDSGRVVLARAVCKGNVFKRFLSLAEQIGRHLKVRSAVLDGEIVCLDADGRSQFRSLLYHRGTPYFYSFDLLQRNGKELRSLPLITRKQHLRKLIPNRVSPLLYVDHIEERGEDLFELACREDLEGIVAKRKDGPYESRASWVKIKNPAYSQIISRNELFEKRLTGSVRQRAERLGYNG